MAESKETQKQYIGRMGEGVACRFLVKKGYSVIGRNYRRKWGEIDVIVKKGEKIHFVEVKTVSCENVRTFSHETLLDSYRPEDNVHPWKVKRLHRVIQSYLAEHNMDEMDWQLDVVAVFLDITSREARVQSIENIS